MTNWLKFDKNQMRTEFQRCAFAFSHRLHKSSLFELSPLAELAEYLYQEGGRLDVYNAAKGKFIGDSFTPNGERGLSPGHAIEQIRTSDSWMVLKRIEKHPDYRDIVDACLDELSAAVPQLHPKHLLKAEGFIFVTSPGGITPYHIDPQWSFLAQIRGKKTYKIFDVNDPTVITPKEIEEYYSGVTMAAQYNESKEEKAAVFHLLPGMCVNQPLHAPHSAEVGDEYSISLSIAIITHEWDHNTVVHLANRELRKIGITPAAVGSHPLNDAAKSFSYRALSRLRRIGNIRPAG